MVVYDKIFELGMSTSVNALTKIVTIDLLLNMQNNDRILFFNTIVDQEIYDKLVYEKWAIKCNDMDDYVVLTRSSDNNADPHVFNFHYEGNLSLTSSRRTVEFYKPGPVRHDVSTDTNRNQEWPHEVNASGEVDC